MSKESQQLLHIYQSLELYIRQALTNPEQTTLIGAAEQLATEFCHASINKTLLFSQLALTPAEFSECTQLAFKQWVLLQTLSIQGQWPASYTEDLLACALFRLSAVVRNLPQLSSSEQQQQLLQKAGLYRLKLSGAAFHHRQWRQLLTDSSLQPGQKTAWQLLPNANAMQFCCQMAYAITPTLKRPAIGLEQALRAVCLQPDPAGSLALVQRLAVVGPTLYLHGRFASDSIGNLLFLTAIEPQLRGHLFDISSKKLLSQHQEITESSLKLLPPRRLPDPQWLDYFSTATEDELQLLPPLDLLQLRQLDPKQSIRQQVQWLQQYPQYAAFLLQQATVLNRQQKTVTQLQHAVALIGAEQLPQLLKQAWLTEQMAILAQPYRGWFQQFSNCLAQALMLLTAKQPSLPLTLAQAHLVAASISYTLQQDDRFRYLPLQAAGSRLSPLVHQCYLHCWQTPEFPRQTALLAASMGVPQIWQDALMNFRDWSSSPQPPHRPAIQTRLVLAFALQLTEALFYGVVARPQQNEQLYLQLCQTLQLSAASWLHWLHRLNDGVACYWPTQPDL